MSDEPWLDDDELRTWRRYQALTTLLEARLDRQLQVDSGMPHGYFAILARLSAAPDRARRMTSLANATSTSQSRISHAVAALEKRGWVRRQRCDDDTRGILAALTDAGADALAKAAPGHARQVRADVFDRLSTEQVTQLGEICATLLAGLDPDRLGADDLLVGAKA